MKKIEEKLFEFLNSKKVKYLVTRGYDKESIHLDKDLDILILKRDYNRIKDKIPKTKRVLDFYLDEEKHFGIKFVPKGALNRRKFDKKLGFFVLSKSDLKRMIFLRKFLKFGRQIKKVIRTVFRNYRLFGLRYVLWDIPYQISRKLNSLIKIRSLPEKFIQKKVNDYKMWVNERGKGIHRDLNLNGTREKISSQIVKEILKEGDVVLEAGANIGYYTILESKKVGSSGLVYAVEPIKETFDILKKNIVLNQLKNVKTYNLAFNEKKGNIAINLSSESNLSTPAKTVGSEKQIILNCESLDSFFKDKKKPNFMRADIEGFEHKLFKGGLETLNSLNAVFVELHFPLVPKNDMTKLLRLFQKKGFEIYRAVFEWERNEDESSFLGRLVNWIHNKRSKPVVYKNLTINKLLKNKDIMEGHLSLEVFFIKNKS